MTKQEHAIKEERLFTYYCENWLIVNRSRLKASSSAKYLTNIEKHIIPFLGNYRLSEITSEEMDRFIHMLLYEKKLSPKTVRGILALFHTIFLYAGRRSREKLPDLEIVYPKGQKKEIRVLDAQEEELLVRFLAEKMDLCKLGVYLALRTGLRIGEVCGLKWGNISLCTRTLSINQTAQRIRSLEPGTDMKTRVVIGTPKTDSSCRMIPLMPDLVSLCSRFASQDPEAFLLTGTRCCMEPRKLQRRLEKYTKECGITEVHFHTLRHTFATRCMEAGFDVKTLSEILGHSNIGITLNQYVHPSLDQKRKNMNRLKVIMNI